MQSRASESPNFIIWAVEYTHKSDEARAIHRLCHLLNEAGYSARLLPSRPDLPFATNPEWNTPLHFGPVGRSIVIYPEIVSGNPLNAERVVRWVLNLPGKPGGDACCADGEMGFVYEPEWLSTVNRTLDTALAPERVLTVPILDPKHVYPDPQIKKNIDCVFTYRGKHLRKRFPISNEHELVDVEENTPSMAALGLLLRRTRTLYSYDHGSVVVREAMICGANVLVMDDDGRWIDPTLCGCAYCAAPRRDLEENNARRFDDPGVVDAFVAELRSRWPDLERVRPIERRAADWEAMVETALNRLNDEIAAVGPRVDGLNRALDQQKLTAGHTLARIETERRRAAQTTAAQFDTLLDPLRRAVEGARADLDIIKNGIETWLLPTMARHEGELRRRGGWLCRLRRSAGWIRPTPSD
jgi:hypothetical protein